MNVEQRNLINLALYAKSIVRDVYTWNSIGLLLDKADEQKQ